MIEESRLRKYIMTAVLVLALLAMAAAWGAGGNDSDSTPTDPTLVVKNENDSGDDSLRDVLVNANDGDIIVFAPGVTTIILTSGEIEFSQSNITIDGGGVVTITKNAADFFRLLKSTASSGKLTLKGLTVENGKTSGFDGVGGGMCADSDIVLENCIFRNNTSEGYYGGGGVHTYSGASMTDCTFIGNTSARYGGGALAWGDTSLTRCTFTDNMAAQPYFGGGIFVIAPITMIDCTFTGNTAGAGGGSAAWGHITATGCTFTGNTANDGGAVSSGSIELTRCDFTGNHGGTGGGVSIMGGSMTGCTFTDNDAEKGAGLYTTGGTTLTGCTFTRNKATNGDGGGVCAKNDLDLINCTFTNNTSNLCGGGVCAEFNTALTGCTFTGNTAKTGGGLGVNGDATLDGCTFTGNTAESGGGARIINEGSLTGCTFTGNTAEYSGGGMFLFKGDTIGCTFTDNRSGKDGGGLFVSTAANVKQCTFTDNTAGRRGGGVDIESGTLDGCTFTGNTANDGGGIRTSTCCIIGCALSGNTADRGGAVYTFKDAGHQTPVLVNCTISENTTLGSGSGAVDCSETTYIFQCTVTNNSGRGVCANNGASAHIYNCIVMGNTSSQFGGEGTIDSSFGNIVSGENMPGSSPPVNVTNRLVFGLNVFDPATGTHKVLINGIAVGKATAITAADIAATTIDPARQTEVLGALAVDQDGASRPSYGPVTHGAVENGENRLIAVAVTTQPDKAVYLIGEVMDLTGTKLTLTYTNGTEVIDHFEPEVAMDDSGVNMNVPGTYTVYFTVLEVVSDPGAYITVVEGALDTHTDITAAPPSPQPYGTEVTLTATVSSGTSLIPSGTVRFFDGSELLGTAVLSGGSASLAVSGLSIGTHSFTAVYEGSSAFNGSTSSPLPYIILGDGDSGGSGGGGGGGFTIDGGNIVKVYGDPNFFITTRGGGSGAVTWKSSDTTLLEVDAYTGEITIKGATNGKIVVITATKAGVSASVTVTVLRKPMTVTADDKVKHAGDPDPPLTYTVSGLLSKDQDVLVGSLKCVAGSRPGTYEIVEDIPFAAEPNYTVTFVKGKMTVLGDDGYNVCCCWWIIILLILIGGVVSHRLYLEYKLRKREREGSDS